MAIHGISATTPTASAGAAQAPNPLGQLGKDAFLKLLVAQLKYQNPMQPTDNQAFMQQLALFSMLEQLQAIRSDLDSIKAGQGAALKAPSSGGAQP